MYTFAINEALRVLVNGVTDLTVDCNRDALSMIGMAGHNRGAGYQFEISQQQTCLQRNPLGYLRHQNLLPACKTKSLKPS